MRKTIFLSLIIILISSCNRHQEKDLNELDYIPNLPEEILVVVNEDSYEEFPTILKFSSDRIVISRFQDSDEYDTGYEDVTLEILGQTFIEDGDFQLTKYKTDSNTITLSANKKNENIYYVEGLDPPKKLTLLGINDNLLEQILNLKK